MRKLVLALCAVTALGVSLPIATTAQAQGIAVTVDSGRHDRDRNRGYHRGWNRGHHYGWDRGRRHSERVVVLKRNRHHND